MKQGKMNVVFGGQAGSEAKGKQSAYLADKFGIRYFACNMSPNAGHVWVGDDGEKVTTHHVPAGIMGAYARYGTLNDVRIVLGPASVINPEMFMNELYELGKLGLPQFNVIVDERAAIILPHHVEKENREMLKIGSTAQGVGEARADKVMRKGMTALEYFGENTEFTVMEKTNRVVLGWMRDRNEAVLYEASQGFDLCLNHGVDPKYCTSRMISPQACLADMGVPVRWLGDTYAVIRTYPIRVNNRKGSSGPYPSKEITWELVRVRSGAPHDLTEMTTTTKLPRRVFEFAWGRIKEMVEVCDPTWLCLQFGNYLNWDLYGEEVVKTKELTEFCLSLEETSGKKVAYVGTSEKHGGMIDRRWDKWVVGGL